MNIKVIKSGESYTQAMARLYALMALDPKAGSNEDSELELLALVIEDYERKIVPPAAPDPVDAILFRMDQMGLGRKDLALYIGSISKVSEVLSRKRPLSLSMIRRLHQGLGIPADVLIGGMEGEQAVIGDEPEMNYTKFPLKEMLDRGCFGDFKGNAQRLKSYAEDIVRQFMRDLLSKKLEPAFLRAPLHQRGTRDVDGHALLAWRLCVLSVFLEPGGKNGAPARFHSPCRPRIERTTRPAHSSISPAHDTGHRLAARQLGVEPIA